MLLAFVLSLATAQAPTGWSCDPSSYADSICDCGCSVKDSDCSSSNFKVCARSGCSTGQVPWEHQNASCMASTCGDGWKADDEACDDGNALASGGCGAGCAAVNDGYVCGERASGCTLAPAVDAGDADAGVDAGFDAGTEVPPDAGQQDAGTPAPDAGEEDPSTPAAGGCSSAPGGLSMGLLSILSALVLATRAFTRRRSRNPSSVAAPVAAA